MKFTPLEHKVSEIAAPVIEDMGLELICVRIVGEGGSKNVQVMAEDPKTGRLGIDECTKLSKSLSALLDVEDPIQGAYRLEISSPGIDRPLMRLKDFVTYKGFEAKLETSMPTENGQKRFRGIIKDVKDDVITIDTDQGEADIAFDMLSKAKLVLTDELIKKTAGGTS